MIIGKNATVEISSDGKKWVEVMKLDTIVLYPIRPNTIMARKIRRMARRTHLHLLN